MAFRVIQQSFWTDEKVIDNYSCEDKYFFLYLLTNPHTSQLGIYKLPLKIASFELGYSKEQVIVLIERFEKVLKQIKYNYETQEIAILNFLVHSVVSGGKPVESCILKDISKISDKSLINFVFGHLKHKDLDNTTIKKIIHDYINENENEKQNDNEKHNDNDNGESYHESYHESQKPKKQDVTKQVSDLYIEICTELPKINKLTDSRKGKIRTLLKTYSIEEVTEMFEKANSSDFITGKNSDWNANFDWLINTTNATKVIEGNYDNKKKTKRNNYQQQKSATEMLSEVEIDEFGNILTNGKSEFELEWENA